MTTRPHTHTTSSPHIWPAVRVALIVLALIALQLAVIWLAAQGGPGPTIA